MLGSARGGIEVSRHAQTRPAPTGAVFDMIAKSPRISAHINEVFPRFDQLPGKFVGHLEDRLVVDPKFRRRACKNSSGSLEYG